MNRSVALALKIAMTAALLGFLAHKAEWDAVGRLLQSASPGWAVLGVLLGFPSLVVAGLRWRQISVYLGVPLPWGFAVLGSMESITFNILLPGSIGGDVLRVAKVTRARGKLRRNFAAVVFDRAVNLGVLLVLCLVLLPLSSLGAGSSLGPGSGQLTLVLGGLAAAVAVGLIALVAALRFRPLRRMRLAREAVRFATLFAMVFLRPKRLAAVGLLSLFGQGLVIAMFAAAARALGLVDLSLLQLSIGTTLALLASSLPLTIAGLGLREGAAIWALMSFGVDEALAYSVAFLFGAALILQGLPGLAVWVAGLAQLPPRK
jgi:glycosyltransferase 2 family protein